MNERPQKVFTLDDGTEITPNELAKQLRMSKAGAWARLNRYSEPKAVFAKPGCIPKKFKKRKMYLMDDGKYYSSFQIESITGLKRRLVRQRLNRGWRDWERVRKQPDKTKQRRQKTAYEIEVVSEQDVQKMIEKRNFNDEMSRLALKVI